MLYNLFNNYNPYFKNNSSTNNPVLFLFAYYNAIFVAFKVLINNYK